MRMNRRCVTGEEAVTVSRQHKKPCADCPFARTALNGWLGELTADEWIQAAHGEALVDCHCTTNAQCAGIAIYRANVCKRPLPPSILLTPNKVLCFATPMEFKAHHTIKKASQ